MIINREHKNEFANTLNSGEGTKVHSHAYIIEGDFGVGKEDFAEYCAAGILCEGSPSPCNVCRHCKKVFSKNHPDVRFFGGEGGKAITMKEVRELITASTLLPNEAEKQIFVIRLAHKMRTDTQNAMLKIFEEPPVTVVVFFLTDKRESLLPTILSRGRLITLKGLSDEEMTSYLTQAFPKESAQNIKAAVRSAQGSVGQGEAYFQKDNVQARGLALEILDTLFFEERSVFYNKMFALKITRDKLSELLELILRYITDIILYKHKGEGCVLLEIDQAERYGSKVGKRALFSMSDGIVECIKTIANNGNINAAVTNLGIKMAISKG